MKKILGLAACVGMAVTTFAVRPTTIYLVQHTHTDIGYTRPQAEILGEHLRYIDFALEYCALTDDYPDEAKFRWTCEAAWTVSEYLKVRPKEQVEKLLARIREGRIEVTAMYFNMAEVADETALRYFLRPVGDIRARGIPVRLAMQNDVNGVAWVLADYLKDLGVEYLWTGSNSTRSVIPFDRPTVFRWESPSGEGVMFYRGETYAMGNWWGLPDCDMGHFERAMNAFLNRIDAVGYPFDALAIHYSGFLADNAAPSRASSDFIRRWNAAKKPVKLVNATASTFFDHLKKAGAFDGVPVQRAAYPDWWTDGFGSAARETLESRTAQVDFAQATALLSMARLQGITLPTGIDEQLASIQKDQLFYAEHTYGASMSVSDPACWNTQVQWGDKAAYAWAAKRNAGLLKETADGLLQAQLPRGDKATLTLFNPHGERRNGYATVFIDNAELPLKDGWRFTGPKGETLSAMRFNSGHGGAYYRLFAKDLPPFGFRTYTVESAPPAKVVAGATLTGNVFESARYRVTFDLEHAGISSIYDKALTRELVDPKAEYALGEIIHETFKDRARPEVGDRTRARPVRAQLRQGADFALYSSVILTAETPASDAGTFSMEVKLMTEEPTIEFVYSISRKPSAAISGIYVAFPFAGERMAFDVPGGDVVPGVTQIEGSASDWNTVQNYVAAFSKDGATYLSMPETPLVQFGRMWNGVFNPSLRPCRNAHVYSWVMNNYWFTNFRASQDGCFHWTYTLASVKDASCASALRFGRADRTPFPARLMPKGRPNGKPAEWSGLAVEGAAMVMGVQPARGGKGLVVLVRMLEAGSFALRGPNGKPLMLRRIDATERPIGNPSITQAAPAGANLILLVE